jgi:hypothetical protein
MSNSADLLGYDMSLGSVLSAVPTIVVDAISIVWFSLGIYRTIKFHRDDKSLLAIASTLSSLSASIAIGIGLDMAYLLEWSEPRDDVRFLAPTTCASQCTGGGPKYTLRRQIVADHREDHDDDGEVDHNMWALLLDKASGSLALCGIALGFRLAEPEWTLSHKLLMSAYVSGNFAVCFATIIWVLGCLAASECPS